MTSIFPNHTSNVQGRKCWVKVDTANKLLTGYNGALFAPATGWTVTTWPNNPAHVTSTAKLNTATNGNVDAGELADGTGIAFTADGDGGTFIVLYS